MLTNPKEVEADASVEPVTQENTQSNNQEAPHSTSEINKTNENNNNKLSDRVNAIILILPSFLNQR